MQLIHSAYVPAGDGPHPTVIALHGWGANSLDLLGLAPHLCGGGLQVVCPQGPVEVPIAPGMNGYGWFPLSMGAPPDPDAFRRAADALDAFIAETARRYAVANDRMALLGFSQGGVMAYALALRPPRRFAAVAALSTWLAPGLIDRLAAPEALRALPMLVQHGASDDLIGVERGRESVDDLRRCGANVRFREYAMGHEISAESLRDLGDFLAAHLVSRIVLA